MSTLGLGDLKPITNVGYVVNSISMYSGVIILSIAVMLLRNIFELNTSKFSHYFRIKKDINYFEIIGVKTIIESHCLFIYSRIPLENLVE